MPRLADIFTCTGCLACVDLCPQNALAPIFNEEGHLTYDLNPSLCIDCGLCEKVCPIISNMHYGENALNKSTPYAAWTTDSDLRRHSTSGGVFAAIAKVIIENGGVVVGVQLESNTAKHTLISKCDDLYKLQGSKYMQSSMFGVYSKVLEHLKSGKDVLFSGLACQVAGIISYMSRFKYAGKLYTIDLICGGVPSKFIVDRFIEHYPDIKEIVAFRNKYKYECSVINSQNQSIVIPLDKKPFPLCGFYTEMTNRYICYDCRFAKAHRASDITIGDLWGDKQFINQHKDGISVAVAHSQNGLNLLNKANLEVHAIEWKNFIRHNHRMVFGRSKLSQSYARQNLAYNFAHLTYEQLLEIYANKATFARPYTIINKLFRFIQTKYREFYNRLVVNKILKQK